MNKVSLLVSSTEQVQWFSPAVKYKKLQDVLAVQALSRLNRSCEKYGKKTEDLFILDFFNSVDDIKKSFDPFYTATTLSKAVDVNVLHEIKGSLDGVGVYEQQEVEQFIKKYFNGVDAQALSIIIDIAADRFNHELALDESETMLEPQNPNPRGVHGGDDGKEPLDEIIKEFNQRWFHGWEATPEDQKVKFILLGRQIMAHSDYQSKYFENKDSQHKDLAFKKMLDEVMSEQRKRELELYKLYAKDESFYQAFFDTMKRVVDNPKVLMP